MRFSGTILYDCILTNNSKNMKKYVLIALFLILASVIGVSQWSAAKEQVGKIKNSKLACIGSEKKCNVLDTRAVGLDQSMRKLWEEHITWTRLYIVETAGDLDGASTTATRLLKNQEDIGNAVKPYYGEAAGNELTNLLEEHIQGAVNILNAAKANDTDALNQAVEDWYENGDEIATFLHNANPDNWPLEEMKMHMKDHLGLTLSEATHQLEGNYVESVADYDEVHEQILDLADMLTRGIIAQFPEKF